MSEKTEGQPLTESGWKATLLNVLVNWRFKGITQYTSGYAINVTELRPLVDALAERLLSASPTPPESGKSND